MELVYLWVEEYKNIKRQGFNFSPRFRCEYDEKKNELIINENKDYVNIFPDNVNITAIIGENGVGKSSIGGEFLSKKLMGVKPEDNKCIFMIERDNKIYLFNDFKEDIIINTNLKYQETFFYDYENILQNLFGENNSLENLVIEEEILAKEFEFLKKKNKTFNINTRVLNNLGFRKTRPDLYNIGRFLFSIISEFSSRDNQFTANSYRVIRPLERKDINSYDEIIGKLDGLQDIVDLLGFPFTVEKIGSKVNFLINDEKVLFGALSFGQKYSIHVLASIYHRLKNNKETIFFLDEVTLSMNPKLERKFINILIKIVEKVEKEISTKIKVHFIITSHSPFIISDIPERNILFLTRDVNNMCYPRPFTSLNMKTFAANIHTLLSHGFFMEDGLMGEFAKSKVTNILKFLNDEYKFIDLDGKTELSYFSETKNRYFEVKLKQIIEMIGEDFLRKKLLDLYYKKFEKEEKQRNKKILEQQIRDMQKQLDELNNDKD